MAHVPRPSGGAERFRFSVHWRAPPLVHGTCAVAGVTQRHDDKTLYTRFPHHGLDAYEVALEALAKADALAKKVPRG